MLENVAAMGVTRWPLAGVFSKLHVLPSHCRKEQHQREEEKTGWLRAACEDSVQTLNVIKGS